MCDNLGLLWRYYARHTFHIALSVMLYAFEALHYFRCWVCQSLQCGSRCPCYAMNTMTRSVAEHRSTVSEMWAAKRVEHVLKQIILSAYMSLH